MCYYGNANEGCKMQYFDIWSKRSYIIINYTIILAQMYTNTLWAEKQEVVVYAVCDGDCLLYICVNPN